MRRVIHGSSSSGQFDGCLDAPLAYGKPLSTLTLELVKQMSLLVNKMNRLSVAVKGLVNSSTVRPQGERGSSKVVRCWKCRSTDHRKRDCPEFRCWHCGKTGHYVKKCPDINQHQ